ncbi:MAG: hypothetical protein GX847_01135 [Clostridiales bacterium]|nr:hypothetical protein [Clostridiales bacterium]
MPEEQLYEVVANLVLQSVSVWEDMHLYAMTYSMEYNSFWELLDENLKETVCRYRRQNREERLVPFSIGLIIYYKGLLTKENFERIKGLHWRKQLKIIMADSKFRIVMTRLNLELKGSGNEYRYLKRGNPVSEGNIRVSHSNSRPDAVALYNSIR